MRAKYAKGQKFTEIGQNTADLIEITRVNYKDSVYELRLTYDGQCEEHGDSYPFECSFEQFEQQYQPYEEEVGVS